MADRRCNVDDQQRFAGWVREHGRAVRGFLLAMIHRPEVADDLCQEVFCRAWQARSTYREQGNPRAYLLRIADRLARDWGRKAKPQISLSENGWKQYEPLDATSGPLQRIFTAEAAEQLAAAIDRLSPIQRRVLLLRYYGQFSFAEIADIVDCPLNTVLSHCRRGLEALRKRLSEKVS